MADHVAEPVGVGQLARPGLGRAGVIERERLQGLDQVAGVRVNHRVRAFDELGKRRVRQPLGERPCRVAREAAVEVLAVLGHDERAPGPERGQVQHRNGPHPAAQAGRLQLTGPAAHRGHRRVLAAVYPGDHRESGAVVRAGDLHHRHVEPGEIERPVDHASRHLPVPFRRRHPVGRVRRHVTSDRGRVKGEASARPGRHSGRRERMRHDRAAAKEATMKIFLSSDMEGTAGVVDWEQCAATGRRRGGAPVAADEVNAAIEGPGRRGHRDRGQRLALADAQPAAPRRWPARPPTSPAGTSRCT